MISIAALTQGSPSHTYQDGGAMGEDAEQMEPCHWILALILSVMAGFLGLDRFYLGYRLLGTAKLLTFGGCGLWALYDIVLISTNQLPDVLGRPLVK